MMKTLVQNKQHNELILASLLFLMPAAGILLHYINITTLQYSLLFFTPLAILIACILFWHVSKNPISKLVVYGLLGGLTATLVYDLVRLVLFLLGLVTHPFISVELWGVLIIGSDQVALSNWAGWIFHFWNGMSFGIFFALAFGRPTIFKGIMWGIILELALVLTSPKLLFLTIEEEFLTSSFLGHIAYGIVLAMIVRDAKINRNFYLGGR